MSKVYIIRLYRYRDENSFEFVAKTQFLCVVCWVMLDYVGSILSLSVEEVIYFLLDLRIYRRTVNKCPISFLTSTYNTSEHKSINKTDPSFHTFHSTEPYLFSQATSLSDFQDISSPLPSHFSETFIYFFTLYGTIFSYSPSTEPFSSLFTLFQNPFSLLFTLYGPFLSLFSLYGTHSLPIYPLRNTFYP